MISKIKQIRTALSEGTAVPFRMWRFFLRRTKEFAAFLQHSMERYSYIYGSLSGPVLLLLWVYTCMFCWLLGAELNRLWESYHPHS